MDLVKIGKFIAQKRKETGLTQKQLAERLGMSDKSVSKWERGICLPDVSIYLELCSILGISINEFLAGEEILSEDLSQRADENLIQVTTDGLTRQKYLKCIIWGLSLAVVAATVILAGIWYSDFSKPKNIITPVDQDSVEMQTAELLSGIDGAFLFRYEIKDQFDTLDVYVSRYHHGELEERYKAAAFSYDIAEYPTEGRIALVPDFENFSVKLVLAGDGGKLTTDIPILENVKDRLYYGRSATKLEEEKKINFDEEQGLVALIYGENGLSALPVQTIEEGDAGAENDYVYYFSYSFVTSKGGK